jgi:phosphoribosylformylglycinamidine synthase
MKFGIIIFPGTSGHEDVGHVLKNVMQREAFPLWHQETDLSAFGTGDCLILPGGFAYGDHLRPGALARFSPIMESMVEFALKGGFVWGISNGFQILCEAGLLPGALLQNENLKFICKDVYLKPQTNRCALTSNILNKEVPLRLPIAHGAGRYYADAETLQLLERNDQILFKYCDADGNVDDASNPNGSLANIAGICNAQRNVFGLMARPERATEEALGNTDGKVLFESLIHTATNLVEG